jgi:hypothetical protein
MNKTMMHRPSPSKLSKLKKINNHHKALDGDNDDVDEPPPDTPKLISAQKPKKNYYQRVV